MQEPQTKKHNKKNNLKKKKVGTEKCKKKKPKQIKMVTNKTAVK